MIEKLKIKNFKSHEDSDIDFTPGLNIFLGEVGAGKTSILEAISFALFGKYAGNINQNGLIRRGAEKAEISLIFSTTTGRYKIERMISEKKTQKPKMSIYDGKDWRLAVEGATAVSKSVEDFLNVDTSTFLAAIYASQSEIKEMLETQPGKRRERLDKLLGIDMYEKIWKTLGEAEHIVLKELTDAQDKASGVNVYEKQLKDIRFRLNSGKKELSNLRNSFVDIDRKIKPTTEQLKHLNRLKQELTTVNTQIEGKNDEIEKSRNTIMLLRTKLKKAEKASAIFERNKKFIDLENKLREEQKRIEIALQNRMNIVNLLQRDKRDLQQENDSQNKLHTLLKGLNSLEKELKILEMEKKPLPTLIDEQSELQGGLDALNVQLIKASNEIENQKQKVNRIVELGECPTCLQIVQEEHKERIRVETYEVINKFEGEYTSLNSSKERGYQRLEELKHKIERAEAADRKYFERRIQIKMLESRPEELKYVEDRIEHIKTRITKNQNKMSEIKETSQTLKNINSKLETVIQKSNLAREAELQSAAKAEFEGILREEENKRKELNTQLVTYRKLEMKLRERYSTDEHVTIEENIRVLREERAKIIGGMSRLERTMEDNEQQVKR
ncbi:SMC family ATPase, partial [Candidatus Bathyarchaeota archaeon]|nr:SMC family ATPase [Candidatus Bathyarchaeota archaeon]